MLKLELIKLEFRKYMINKIFVLFTLSFVSLHASEIKKELKVKSCLSAREFITTVEFLRDFKDLAITEKSARYYADKVSTGCSGAGQRFIKVTKLLTKVGVDSKSALESAISFINQEDNVVDAFIKTSALSYEEDFLDLDALSAMKISLRLSSQFKGNAEIARDDFKDIALYCKDKKKLNLPLATCAKIATDVALLSEKFQEKAAQEFIELLEFLSQDRDGPGLDLNMALKISMDLINYGPKANKNFQQAYEYAIEKDGLSLSSKDALDFAQNISKRSYKDI